MLCKTPLPVVGAGLEVVDVDIGVVLGACVSGDFVGAGVVVKVADIADDATAFSTREITRVRRRIKQGG